MNNVLQFCHQHLLWLSAWNVGHVYMLICPSRQCQLQERFQKSRRVLEVKLWRALPVDRAPKRRGWSMSANGIPPLSLKGLCWKFKDGVVYRTQMCVYVAGISRIHWRWFARFASYLYSNQSIEGATVACSLLDSGERRTRSSTCPVHRPQNVSLYEPHVQHKCCFLSNSRLRLTAPSLQ